MKTYNTKPGEFYKNDEEEEFKEPSSPSSSDREMVVLPNYHANNSIPHLREPFELEDLKGLKNHHKGLKEPLKGANPSQSFVKPGILKQTLILFKKNFKVAMKKPSFLVSQFSGAVFTCLLILFLNHLIRYNYEHGKPQIFKTRKVADLEQWQFSDNCKSLGYIVLVSYFRINSEMFSLLKLELIFWLFLGSRIALDQLHNQLHFQ